MLEPVISVAQFAHQRQLQKHQEIQKYNTLLRLRDLHVSVHLSTRLLRVAVTSQKGLVESFKHGDKSGFAAIYNAIHDIRETCDSTTRRHILDHDPLVGTPNNPVKGKLPNFAERLSPNSRTDLLDILTLIRTDSQFLFHCISNLTPSQLSAFVSPVHSLELCGSGSSPLDSRGRNQASFFKRNASHSPVFKEHAFSFERTDPLSTLIFNVYATTLGSESAEHSLRLDVWSSTCAKLVSHGGSGQYTFVGHLFNIWSGFGEWKVKPKFEIYLMDVLQKGAFLLEHSNNRSPGVDGDYLDPMRTDLAEQFFRSSVQDLFAVLDDSDGGFPPGALEFGKCVVEKLGFTEARRRFLGYMFYQWFFCKFLHNAICFPEVSSSTCSVSRPFSFFLSFFFVVRWLTSRCRCMECCLIFISLKMLGRDFWVKSPFMPKPRFLKSYIPRKSTLPAILIDYKLIGYEIDPSSRMPAPTSEYMWKICYRI